jgi:hypothetical protein
MRFLAVGLSCLVISAGALAYALGGGEGSGGSDPIDPPPPPVNTVFAGVLLRVGLGADVLAAAGISGEQVAALVAAVEQNCDSATLASRDEAYIAARQTHDRLRRLIQSGKGTQEDVTARSTAEATLNTATSARDSYLATARAAGLATVTAEQAARVTKIFANQKWGLPTQYLVKDRTEPEWVALREALAAKRISEQDEDEPLAQSAQEYLAAADAVSEVAAAKVSLDAGIASVQTAWNLAASD